MSRSLYRASNASFTALGVAAAVITGVVNDAPSQSLPSPRAPLEIDATFTTAPTTRPNQSAKLRAIAEAAAAELTCLELDFIYDRAPWRNGPDGSAGIAHWQALRGSTFQTLSQTWEDAQLDAAFAPGPSSENEIRPLLTHDDPKVRTLGIVLWFQLNRLDLLPELVPLLFDNADSFDQRIPFALYNPSGPRFAGPTRQPVSYFARAAIAAYTYLPSSPIQYIVGGEPFPLRADITPDRVQADLAAFIRSQDATTSYAVLRVAAQRAYGGRSPLESDRVGRIDALYVWLRTHVEMPRQFFVLQALRSERFETRDLSAAYMLDLARAMPREMRLQAISGDLRFDDDPYLPTVGAGNFLCDHATELFRAADADFFIGRADGSTTRPSNVSHGFAGADMPRCAVAAARLRPKDATAILVPALARVRSYDDDGAVRIAAALALLGDDEGMDAAIDWCFKLVPQRGQHGGGREAFLYSVAAEDAARGRQLDERIIRDARLDTLGPASTRILMEHVAGYLGRPLADADVVRDSMGTDEAQRDRKFEHLPAWHAALRATVDEWTRD